VKWRNWKCHFIRQDNMYDTPRFLPVPQLVNLLVDRGGAQRLSAGLLATVPIFRILHDFQATSGSTRDPNGHAGPLSAARGDRRPGLAQVG